MAVLSSNVCFSIKKTKNHCSSHAENTVVGPSTSSQAARQLPGCTVGQKSVNPSEASSLHGWPKSCKSLSDASSLPPACLQPASSLPPACLHPASSLPPACYGRFGRLPSGRPHSGRLHSGRLHSGRLHSGKLHSGRLHDCSQADSSQAARQLPGCTTAPAYLQPGCTTAPRLHGWPKICKSLSEASSLHGWPKSCKSLSDASSLPPACPYREHRQIQGDLTFSSNIFVPITLLHQALQWRQVHVGNQTLGRSRPSSGPARNQASQESCQPGTILPIFLAGCILAGCILAGSILAGCTTAPRLHDRAEILRT